MKKPASKVAKPAQIQPKSQFLFHKNLPPRDFSIMTLGGKIFVVRLHEESKCPGIFFLFTQKYIIANSSQASNSEQELFLVSLLLQWPGTLQLVDI